jgi:hypothetical protein
MVKTVKQELEVDDTFPQCSNVLVSSTFIELSYSFTSEDLAPLPSSTKSSKNILRLKPLCHQSHPPMWGVFSLLFFAYA